MPTRTRDAHWPHLCHPLNPLAPPRRSCPAYGEFDSPRCGDRSPRAGPHSPHYDGSRSPRGVPASPRSHGDSGGARSPRASAPAEPEGGEGWMGPIRQIFCGDGPRTPQAEARKPDFTAAARDAEATDRD